MGSAEEADDAITAAEAAEDAGDVDDDVGEKTRRGMTAAQVEAASAKETAVEDSSPTPWKEEEIGTDDDDAGGGTEDEAEEERGVNTAGEISEEDSGELEGIVGVRKRLW